MPEFSTEFWVATIVAVALAILTLLLGFGVTLGMDAKTRGEFRFASGCFIFSALMIASTIILWGVTTQAAMLKRVLISAFLFAVVGVFSVEAIRWTHGRHIRARTLEEAQGRVTNEQVPTEHSPVLPNSNNTPATLHPKHSPTKAHSIQPYSRTETFIIDVAYYSDDDGFPLPTAVLSNEDYPFAEAYSRLGEVLMLYAPPDAKQITQIPALDTIDKRSEALVQSLRACIIGEIVTAERGSRKFGISATKGSIADYNPGISPPRSTDYPPEKLVSILGALPFGKNERFLLLYRNRPLLVPEGSEVKLGVGTMGGKYDSMAHALFTIANPPVFTLTFGVAPINAATGIVPGSFSAQFKSQQAKYTTYSLSVTMKIEIQRDAVSASEIEDYIHWADELWVFIRNRYDIKRAS
jgi:hypothetical protein